MNHKNYKKRTIKNEYFFNSSMNLFLSVSLFILCFINKDLLFSKRNVISIPNVFFYLLIVDMFYYWYHRTIHRIPKLKEYVHSEHHNAYNVVPLDILHSTISESTINFVITNLFPLFLVDINLIEYLIINIILVTHSTYIHFESKSPNILPLFIDSSYHKYHHQIGKGNYSGFFPIWDNFMKTRIKITSNHQSKTKKKRQPQDKKQKQKQKQKNTLK